LHLLPDPIDVLASFRSLLSEGGVVVLLVPNVLRLSTYWGRIRRDKRFQDFGGYQKTGVQLTSHKTVRSWFRSAGMGREELIDVLSSPRAQMVGRLTLGLMDQFLASEVIAIAKRE
jgi:hypothetical protein